VLPATAAPSTVTAGDWHRVALEGVTPRSVGLATRRRSLLSAPGRAVAEVLRRMVAEQGRSNPGVVPASAPEAPPGAGTIPSDQPSTAMEQRLRG
jgi:hypothetical protein